MSPVYIQIAIGGSQEVGERYHLICNVTGADVNLFQWRKNGEVLSETGPSLILPSLRLSDTGHYTCQVMVYTRTYTAGHEIVLTSK